MPIPPEPSLEFRTASFRITKTRDKRCLSRLLELALHFQNLIILLYSQAIEVGKQSEDAEMLKLAKYFLDKGIMRAIAWGQSGGKRAGIIAALKAKFGDWELFRSLQATGQKLKDKNVYQLVGKIAAAYKSFWTKRAKKNSAPEFAHARPPRPRKLKTLQSESFFIPIDLACLSFKTADVLAINLRPGEAIAIDLPFQPLLHIVESFDQIRQLEIGIRHGEIYLNFNYLKATPVKEQGTHAAGLDLGINNIAAIYLDDNNLDTPSLVISGQKYSSYNAEANRKIAKLKSKQSAMSKDANIHQAKDLQKSINKAFRKRKDYFDTNMAKLAKRTCECLSECNVGTLVTSNNLTFLKNNRDKKSMGRQQNQRFYQMPLGKFLDYLQLNGRRYGIGVQMVDEAYTSKTSAISGDPSLAQKEDNLLKLLDKNKPRSEEVAAKSDKTRLVDALKGRRVSRSRFRDGPTGIVYHADVGAAFNHLRIFANGTMQPHSPSMRPKLVNPRKVHPHALNSFLDTGQIGIDSSKREQARDSHVRIRSHAVSSSNELTATL